MLLKGGWDPRKSHQDLWRRVRSELERLGASNVAARWTKGHARPEDILAGRSTENDARRNEGADKLVHEGAAGWALKDSLAEHFLARRRIAILAQRMAIACVRARFEERARIEQQEEALKEDMAQAFPEEQEVHPGGVDGADEPRDGTGPKEPALRRAWLRRNFPGFDWEGGDGAGYVHHVLVGDVAPKAWRYLPFSLYLPMRWYWSQVKWSTEHVVRGRGRGTTWLQLACDFEASTGTAIFTKTSGGARKLLTIGAKARQFALASMHLLRMLAGEGFIPRRITSLTNLVPIGAGQAAGITPAVSLLRHNEVAVFLAEQLLEHPLQNRSTMRWRWNAPRCVARIVAWDGVRHKKEETEGAWERPLGENAFFDITKDENAATSEDEGKGSSPRSSPLGHDGEDGRPWASSLGHAGAASPKRQGGPRFGGAMKTRESSRLANTRARWRSFIKLRTRKLRTRKEESGPRESGKPVEEGDEGKGDDRMMSMSGKGGGAR